MPTMKEMQLPEGLVDKEKVVWGNIVQIYDFHNECVQ